MEKKLEDFDYLQESIKSIEEFFLMLQKDYDLNLAKELFAETETIYNKIVMCLYF